MKTKKIHTLFLLLAAVAVLSLSLAGCNNNAGEKQTDVKNDLTDGLMEEENGPITFTALTTYVIGGTAWGEDPISRAITEKTNVTLDLEYPTGDFNEKLGALLAAGDYPDLLLSIDNYQLSDLIDANAVYALDEFLVDGGENIKKVFGDKLGAMRMEADNKIYGFNKEFGEIPENRDWYIQIQYPLLKEFGYPKIKTLSELGDLLEEYINKHKTYNGNPLVGVLSPLANNTLRHGINNTAMRTAGFQDDGEFYIDPETYEATYCLLKEEIKIYMKWLNDMYKRGLFSLDSFTLDHGGVQSEVAKGHVLCVTSPDWAIGNAEKALRTINKTPERCYAKIPVYISEEAAKNSQVSNYDSMGTWKSVITKNCKNPKRAFEFFDMMWSEEMQILCNWGVKGDTYTIDENGKRILNPEAIKARRNDQEFRIKTGIDLYNYWSVGTLMKDSTGQYIIPWKTPEILSQSYTDEDREVLHKYNPNAKVWADLWPDPKLSPWGFVWKITLPRGDGRKAQTKVMQEISPKYMLRLVKAKHEDEFNVIWDEYVQKCKDAGIEKREAEVTAAVKKRMQLWYGSINE